MTKQTLMNAATEAEAFDMDMTRTAEIIDEALGRSNLPLNKLPNGEVLA